MWKINILKNQYIADEQRKQLSQKNKKVLEGLSPTITRTQVQIKYLVWKKICCSILFYGKFITKAAFQSYRFLKKTK